MSVWVNTVLLSFGKALLISLSILVGSCCLRFLYRFWTTRLGCKHPSVDDLSESYKYEMELQTVQEASHLTPSSCRSHAAHDAVSEMELPPSPGANTSCPPYNSNCLYPEKPRYDDFSVSDGYSYSGKWSSKSNNDGDETGTDADLTSVAGETTTMCSVLTGNEEGQDNDDNLTESPSAPHPSHTADPLPTPPPFHHPPPMPQLPPLLPPFPESSSSPRQPPPEFQDYHNYTREPAVVGLPPVAPSSRRPAPQPPHQPPHQHQPQRLPQPQPQRLPQPQQDRGTALFLSQYYKSLEHERSNTAKPSRRNAPNPPTL